MCFRFFVWQLVVSEALDSLVDRGLFLLTNGATSSLSAGIVLYSEE